MTSQIIVLAKRVNVKLTPHAFRTFFANRCRVAGVHERFIDYMLGHKQPMDGAYFTDEELREAYMKALPELSVSETVKKFKPPLKPPALWGDSGVITDTEKTAKDYSKLFPEMTPKVHPQPGDTYILEWGDEAMKVTGLTVKTAEFPVTYLFKFEM